MNWIRRKIGELISSGNTNATQAFHIMADIDRGKVAVWNDYRAFKANDKYYIKIYNTRNQYDTLDDLMDGMHVIMPIYLWTIR